jgi:tRNA (cmo5U34)-methyltransferase
MLYAVGGEHMSSEHRVRDTFDRLASEYDELKLRVIPGYRQVEDLALRYANAAARKRVLELGCGSAEWAATFLRNQPTANYVAVEFSPKMRDLASRRLESYRRRVQLLDQDLNDSLPGGPFDLVVSFFAIHHLEKKQRLVEEVFASLAPGGLFLYADITVAADPALERAFQEGWLAFMLGAGLDPERIPHVLADHRDNDLAESSSTQLSYLRAAGFTPAEIIWCSEKFVLFYGAKPIPGDVVVSGAH